MLPVKVPTPFTFDETATEITHIESPLKTLFKCSHNNQLVYKCMIENCATLKKLQLI